MDKRFLTFMLLVFVIVMANAAIMRRLFPPQPAPQAEAQPAAAPAAASAATAKAEVAANPPAAGAPQPADPNAPAVAADAAPLAAAQAFAPQWVSLGSLVDDPKQRILVTLSNRGAVVERVELNNPRYHDVDNIRPLGGYLGHLAETDLADKSGVKVNVVGAGTPAAAAGLKVGDVVTAIDDRPTPNVDVFRLVLRETKPETTAELAFRRDGAAQKVTVQLRRHPLEVVRPEFTDLNAPHQADPQSLLLTLQQFDDQTLASDEGPPELAGLDLTTAYWEVLPADPAQPHAATFRRVVPAPYHVEVLKHFRLTPVADANVDTDTAQAYTLDLRIEVKNLDSKPHKIGYRLDGPTGLPAEGFWYSRDGKIGIESNPGMRDVIYGYFNGSYVEHGMYTCTAIVDKSTSPIADKPIRYAGVDSQYFAAVVLPQLDDPNENRLPRLSPMQVGRTPEPASSRKKLTNVSFRLLSTGVETPAGAVAHRHDYKLFFGPKVPDMLEAYGLGAQIDYGWFDWIAVAMLWILHTFYKFVGNYGIAIVMLTIVVRLMMFPLSRKQALNAAKMQELQPEIKRLAEKYKNKPEEKLKAQQELFKKHNYSVAGGCLPIFIQLPIFVGLYNSLKVDVELRQAPLISESVRWASNLAAPDMFWYWKPFLPDFLAGEDSWLGPFLNLLPCVTIALFLLQQKMFMPPPTDEQSALQQKMMKYMMIFMCVMFFKVPGGLCVYFITSSLWSIAERQLLPKPKPAPMATATLDVGGERKPSRK